MAYNIAEVRSCINDLGIKDLDPISLQLVKFIEIHEAIRKCKNCRTF